MLYFGQMKVLIFGATGKTGRILVTQGLEKGHLLTALVRNPAGLTIKHRHLLLAQGDILNPRDVQKAVKGQEVVISVLGNKTAQALWKPNTVISEGVRNILAAMEEQKVRRLLFVSSFGVSQKIFLPEKLFIRIILKNIFADLPKQEELIKTSSLAWTIVRPARLVNTPRTGQYRVGEKLPIGLFSKISRADVADFLLKNVKKSVFINKIVTIRY